MCTRNRLDALSTVLHRIALVCSISCCTLCATFDAYRAHSLYQSGKHEEAKTLFASLIAHDPTDWRSLYNLGSIELQDAHYEQAVAHFNKVLELQPDNTLARERRDEALKKQEEQEKQQKRKEQDEQQQKKDDEKNKSQESSQNEQQESPQEERQKETPGDQKESSNSIQSQQQKQSDNTNDTNDPTKQEQKQSQQEAKQASTEKDSDSKEQSENTGSSLKTASEKGLTAEQVQLLQGAEKMDRSAQRYMIQQAQQQEGVPHDTHAW